MLENLFSIPIYYNMLKPESETFDSMLDYATNFVEKYYNKEKYNITGDVVNDYLIHNNKVFFWLNEQVSLNMKEYLTQLGVDHTKMNIYAQKSWIASCNKKGGYINAHVHENSIFSAVYYLSCEEASGGYLRFSNSNLIHNRPFRYSETNINNTKTVDYPPIVNKLFIFPSNFEHEVTEYTSNTERISVTYDITITSKSEENDVEHMIIDPSLWRKI